jgi:hypothetical protein
VLPTVRETLRATGIDRVALIALRVNEKAADRRVRPAE